MNLGAITIFIFSLILNSQSKGKTSKNPSCQHDSVFLFLSTSLAQNAIPSPVDFSINKSLAPSPIAIVLSLESFSSLSPLFQSLFFNLGTNNLSN